MELTGTVLRGPEFDPVEGRVVIEDGEIAAIEESDVDSSDIVLPAFVNAHTHLGDSVAKDAGTDLSLEELVAPPDGLKHRLLRETSREELVAGMSESLRFMVAGGTGTTIEFREGGLEGVRALREAAEGRAIDPVILGRETVEAMEASDGFGASGAADGDFSAERRATREAGKVFGIHAGEVDESDINPALDLEPDFLVHMVHASAIHLDRVADQGVPIVVCPRSNADTDVGLPPIEDHLEVTTVALGTDNVMFNPPSMFREMAFTAKTYDLDPRTVLRMATRNGAEIAGLNRGLIEEGREAYLTILDGDSDNLARTRDPVRATVHRATTADVRRLVTPDVTADDD